MLREGIEAALITGIIASYLHRSGRDAWIPAVWIGVLLAVAASLLVGTLLQLVSSQFPQKEQELFAAVVGFIAVLVLLSMVLWMGKAGGAMQSDLRASIDRSFATHGGSGWMLVAMVFLAVAREGVESIFFLVAVFEQSKGSAAPVGALAGLIVSGGVGYCIFVAGIRLDLRRFFKWSGLFILVVASGLFSSAFRNLHEAGIFNLLQERAYDLSSTLPETGPLGAVLAGVFKYQQSPSVGEFIAYVGLLMLTVPFFLRVQNKASTKAAKVRV